MSNVIAGSIRRLAPWLAATLCAVGFVGSAIAQSTPKGLEPLPDIPPPPRISTTPLPEDDESPAITIRQDGENKVEEFRTRGGRLYAVRVTPKYGAPYVLVDPDGKGTMTNATEINGGVRAPQWTILEF